MLTQTLAPAKFGSETSPARHANFWLGYFFAYSKVMGSKVDEPVTIKWGCALCWFLRGRLDCCNSHVEGPGLEKCHGRHEWMRGIYSWRPCQKGPWQPWKEFFQGHTVVHHDPSWFIMMDHHDSSRWIIMMHHDDTSWWCIMMNHYDESSWRIMMSRHDESQWGILKGFLSGLRPSFCHGRHQYMSHIYSWRPRHFSKPRPSKMGCNRQGIITKTS